MSIPQKLVFSALSLLIILSPLTSGFSQTKPEVAQEIKKGTVIGKIVVKSGVPLSFGQVMFYDASAGPPPNPKKYERTPDVSKTLNAEGEFKVELPEGMYYLGAIKRLSGDRLGPPQEGDYVFRSLNELGKPKEYFIHADRSVDVGTFTEAFPLTAEDLSKRSITTAIEGMILSMDWKPVPDVVVVAFTKPSIGGKPLFVSDKSDKDGKYVLPVTEGMYYLRARNSFAAGPPQPGQIVGYYGEGTPSGLYVNECEMKKGIDFQVIVFPGRGPFSGTAPAEDPRKDK